MKPRPLTLGAWHYSVGAVMFVAASLIAPGRAVGQTRQYVVTELSRTDAPGYHASSTTLEISLVERAVRSRESQKQRSGTGQISRRNISALCWVVIIALPPTLMTWEKSLEYPIPEVQVCAPAPPSSFLLTAARTP
jgi:hypothetical protein